ncbi:MAG: tetratricopeptide repeat protein [Chitinophagales bacterium]|nr:tetratricopeptide repeat protein [Chitinophagales bacterium]MDW8419606.1 tetratricopeptide repeat protein [Chitinophagales bacterium]
MADRYCIVLILLLAVTSPLTAQTSTVLADTVPYKVGHYDINKQTKVYQIAARLNVNPHTVVMLNKFRNIYQDLYPGTRIKIPIYPKGYVYEPEKVVIYKNADPDSVASVQLNSTTEETESYNPYIYITADEARERIPLVDAYIELNESMLQGVLASIDTLLAADDNVVTDERNIQEMLLKMKRARDKVLLLPRLEYLRDSFQMEIIKLKKDRLQLVRVISPTPQAQTFTDINRLTSSELASPPNITHDTVEKLNIPVPLSLTPEPVVQNIPEFTDTITEANRIEKNDMKRIEVRRNERKKTKYRQQFPIDTVIVYDVTPTLSPKPEPEKKKLPEIQLVKRGDYWDTARAILPVDTSLFTRPLTLPHDTQIALKVHVPNTLDTVVIKPIKNVRIKTDTAVISGGASVKRNREPEDMLRIVTDTAAVPNKISTMTNTLAINKIISKSERQHSNNPDTAHRVENTTSKDTIKIPSTILPPPIKKRSVAEMALASADSVRRIKAEFFYRRAKKAIADKNFRNAEQYLIKSIELYPGYYDAWFAKAEMEDMFGANAKALKSYQTCVQIDSSKPLLHHKMGLLLLRMNRKSDAFNSFEKAISLNPRFIQAFMERAQLYSEWKKYDLAINDYSRVIDLDSKYHFAYKQRGQVYLLTRQYANAIEDFTRYLALEETDPAAYYYRGLARIGNNDLLNGCMDLSAASSMGYTAAEKAIKKSCQ